MDLTERFTSLFRGRQDVWGSVGGNSNKEPVTLENYRVHLEGKVSLGIYPLLDDGTCFFAAIDLDEKNFEKAIRLRNELTTLGIKIYVCESKSKGYHLYLFSQEPLIAKDVRTLLLGVLRKLDISAEVFPKQDKLDDVIKYGNYINLPCFGSTRQFQTADKKPVATDVALGLIQYNTQEVIVKAVAQVPPPPPLIIPQKPKKEREAGKKHKSPPCVERLLQGVESGMRDEAAFALARHFLDQGEVPEEVLARLLIWDARNKPPIGDMRALQTKVESAEKGYAFGCNSITSGLLSGNCIGKNVCDYFKKDIQVKKKEGLIIEASCYEDDLFIYEEVARIRESLHEVVGAEFLRFDKKTGAVVRVKEIVTPDSKTIWPVISEEIGYGAVGFPDGIEDYGDTLKLVAEVKTHINKYCDLPGGFLELSSWYVLMTWVYHRLPSMVYLRFLGDYDTGKSRSLGVIGDLCYKRTRSGGAVTEAPLYRLMKKYEGTLIIDEADFGRSDETHEIVKILNSGIEKGTPIMRCTKDNPDIMQVFPCFGPKAFATRDRFKDIALESRCLTAIMEETDRDDIPAILAKEHAEAKLHLVNKLLLWRFHNMNRLPEQMSEHITIDLGKIEGRLRQVCLPFASIFADMPETLDRFRRFLAGYSRELRLARMDSIEGRLIYAVFKVAIQTGRDNVTIQAVTTMAADELKLDIRPSRVSQKLRDLSFRVERRRDTTGTRFNYIRFELKLWRKVYRKYLHDLSLGGSTEDDDENEEVLTKILDFPRSLE